VTDREIDSDREIGSLVRALVDVLADDMYEDLTVAQILNTLLNVVAIIISSAPSYEERKHAIRSIRASLPNIATVAELHAEHAPVGGVQ
jgi:hypothetical protein